MHVKYSACTCSLFCKRCWRTD